MYGKSASIEDFNRRAGNGSSKEVFYDHVSLYVIDFHMMSKLYKNAEVNYWTEVCEDFRVQI